MSSQRVTGRTKEELEAMREEYDADEPFDERYCLVEIPKQPDDYDGPPRYCVCMQTHQIGDAQICTYHGGQGEPNPQNLDKLAPMKSGMEATQDHLRKEFDEKDRALYDWVVETFPEKHGIDLESDAVSWYDIHRLAVEIVRAERGRLQLIREGEVVETEKVGENGIVVDQHGEVVTEKSEHYLAQMMHRQDKKITQIEKELGITRKERLKRDSEQDAVDAVKTFAELGKKFIDRDEQDYNPEDEPWDNE